jgi:hypothetical protein
MVLGCIEDRKTNTRRLFKVYPRDKTGITSPAEEVIRFDDGTFHYLSTGGLSGPYPCPYGAPGDLLYVREAHYLTDDGDAETVVYATDPALVAQHINEVGNTSSRLGLGETWLRPHLKLRPGIHMPRWASRLTLEITRVEVERLHDISEADAIAEGVYRSKPDDEDLTWFHDHQQEHLGRAPTKDELDGFSEGVWMVPGVPQGWGRTKAERQRDQWGPTPQYCYRKLWEHINGADSWTANPWCWSIHFRVHKQNVDAFLAERGAA